MAAEVKKGIDTTKNAVPFEGQPRSRAGDGQDIHAEGHRRHHQKSQEASARCGGGVLRRPHHVRQAIEIGKMGIPIAATAPCSSEGLCGQGLPGERLSDRPASSHSQPALPKSGRAWTGMAITM